MTGADSAEARGGVVSACPACAAAPAAGALAARSAGSEEAGRLILSVPGAHCAACISTVERTLERVPGVREARLNLSLKRATVDCTPEVRADDLVAALAAVGYEAHELDPGVLGTRGRDREGRELLMRLGVAGFSMMNVMLLSVAVWSGAEAATRDLLHWISAVIAVPTVAFSAQPFFRNALAAVRVGRLNMDVPISLAILLAVGMSLFEVSQHGADAYFDAALSLTFFLLAGRYLDHRARAAARSAAAELAALEVPRAIRIGPEGDTTVAVDTLAPGDLVRVLPGSRVPVDGIVVEGESEIDRSVLTGETVPAPAAAGTRLVAGETNLTGPLVLRVAAAAGDTALRRMAELVAVAEMGRNRYTSLADRAAAIYAPGVHLLALVTFAGWLVAGVGLRDALNVAIAVLIITCPCALGLAVPAVTTAASGRLFRRNLLVKEGTALERLAEVDTVVFDKTGTLTMGMPEPVGLGEHPRAALEVARALADASAHPLARALASALADAGVKPARVRDVREIPGKGIEGRRGGAIVRLGRPEWVGAEPSDETTSCLSLGHGQVLTFRFRDRLRPGAAALVERMRAMGLEPHVVSGDAPAAVRRLATSLGIEHFVAGALPEEKVAYLERLSASGRKVLMIGDGLNDTAALAAAHASISPASALDAARVASDVVVLSRDLSPVAEALSTARAARRRILENFLLAAAYNAVAIPLAVLGHASPLAAALAMSASSITVSLNAMRLR